MQYIRDCWGKLPFPVTLWELLSCLHFPWSIDSVAWWDRRSFGSASLVVLQWSLPLHVYQQHLHASHQFQPKLEQLHQNAKNRVCLPWEWRALGFWRDSRSSWLQLHIAVLPPHFSWCWLPQGPCVCLPWDDPGHQSCHIFPRAFRNTGLELTWCDTNVGKLQTSGRARLDHLETG